MTDSGDYQRRPYSRSRSRSPIGQAPSAGPSYRRPVSRSRSRSRGRYGAPHQQNGASAYSGSSASYRRRYSRSRSRSRSPRRPHDRYERYERSERRYGDRDSGRAYGDRDSSRGYGGPGRYEAPPVRRTREVYRGTDEERSTTTTLYLGNLPFSYTDRDVAAMMERFGRVRKITVPVDHIRRHNRGFAFVEFEERRDAEDALAKYQGYVTEGRTLRIDWDVGSERKPSANFSAPALSPMPEPAKSEAVLHDDSADY